MNDHGAEHRCLVADAGIVPVRSPVRDVATESGQVVVTTDDGQAHRFDHLYSALGDTIRSDLTRDLGAELADKGCIVTDPHQHTSVDGLFATGNVPVGLDQVNAAMGHAAVAATTIHNRLRGYALSLLIHNNFLCRGSSHA